MNIEDIKKEYKETFTHLHMEDSNWEDVWDFIENLLTQQREEAVRGFREWHNEKMQRITYTVGGINFTPKLFISEESVETYLTQQSLDKGTKE